MIERSIIVWLAMIGAWTVGLVTGLYIKRNHREADISRLEDINNRQKDLIKKYDEALVQAGIIRATKELESQNLH